MQGNIKWFSKKKGYGFITQEDGTDVFLHISSLTSSRIPREGEEVSFDIGTSKTDHPAAVNVIILSPAPKRSESRGHSHSHSHGHHRHHDRKPKKGLFGFLRKLFGG